VIQADSVCGRSRMNCSQSATVTKSQRGAGRSLARNKAAAVEQYTTIYTSRVGRQQQCYTIQILQKKSTEDAIVGKRICKQ